MNGQTTKAPRTALRIAFLGAVVVKGVDGLIETLAGIAVAILGTQALYALVVRFTAPELDLHPQSVHLLRHGASDLTHVSSRFIAIWLLVHGFLKLTLAIELLRGQSWIFPVAVAIFSGFVAYMTYKLAGHFSLWLLVFALFDFVTVTLVLNEWCSHRASADARQLI